MSERKIGAIVALVTVLITLVILALFESNSQPVAALEASPYDKKLDRLDRRGVEGAYTSRVGLLYTNAMTDTNKESQDRMLRGHRNARKIFIEVMTAIDARDPEGKDDGK